MLPNSLHYRCIIGIRSLPYKQVSLPSNTNARTRQHMQSSSPMDPSTLRNPLQRASRSASQMRHPLPGKDHHQQNRPGQVVLARLRSGHNRLNAHIYRKLKIVPSPNVSLWWGGPDNRACSSEMLQTPTRANRTVAFSNSASPEMLWGPGGPEEDHQLHHCCWTGRVGEREEEEDYTCKTYFVIHWFV